MVNGWFMQRRSKMATWTNFFSLDPEQQNSIASEANLLRMSTVPFLPSILNSRVIMHISHISAY